MIEIALFLSDVFFSRKTLAARLRGRGLSRDVYEEFAAKRGRRGLRNGSYRRTGKSTNFEQHLKLFLGLLSCRRLVFCVPR